MARTKQTARKNDPPKKAATFQKPDKKKPKPDKNKGAGAGAGSSSEPDLPTSPLRNKRPQHGGKEPRNFGLRADPAPGGPPPVVPAQSTTDEDQGLLNRMREKTVGRWSHTKREWLFRKEPPTGLQPRGGTTNRHLPEKMHREGPFGPNLGTRALREIRHYQRQQGPLIPMRAFCRLVRELGQDCKDWLILAGESSADVAAVLRRIYCWTVGIFGFVCHPCQKGNYLP